MLTAVPLPDPLAELVYGTKRSKELADQTRLRLPALLMRSP